MATNWLPYIIDSKLGVGDVFIGLRLISNSLEATF